MCAISNVDSLCAGSFAYKYTHQMDKTSGGSTRKETQMLWICVKSVKSLETHNQGWLANCVTNMCSIFHFNQLLPFYFSDLLKEYSKQQ